MKKQHWGVIPKILLNGYLVLVDEHTVPRRVMWPEGLFVMYKGRPLEFNNLIPDGEQHTDAFGWLRNYKLPESRA